MRIRRSRRRRWLTSLAVGVVTTSGVLAVQPHWGSGARTAATTAGTEGSTYRVHDRSSDDALAAGALPTIPPSTTPATSPAPASVPVGQAAVVPDPVPTEAVGDVDVSANPAVSSVPTAPTPTPTPPVAVPPAVTGSSGAAAPAANLPGWRLLVSEDFNTDAGLGRFADVYPGWAGYDGWRDTSRGLGRPASQQGLYDSATTVTVTNGVLDEHLRTAGGTPQVVALTPQLAGVAGNVQTYGRYAVRFRADDVPGYKLAWLLWPASDDWSQGELDFPEGDAGGRIDGFAHDVTGSPSTNAWSVNTSTSMADWHTAVIEWSPGRLTYSLDDRSWTTTDPSAIPTDPMGWVLQTETQLTAAAPDPSVSGHVLIDWVAAWARD